MSTTIGKVLHQTYRLDKALSEGGMGQVFVASHLRIHNRQYAVKRLRPELAASERFLARFRIEAQAMMALEHPNIVRIEDFLVDEHTYYLVMEYIRGRPLDEIIFFQKRLSAAQIVSIAIQMLDALECCHAQHIIHRDLKPSNVLVEESGRIKLTDFGIALQEDLTSRLTNTGTLLGTPDYMSPEQITSKEMDGRSDLYSLGVMLYEMLTGRLPFLRTQESEGSYVILFAHVHTEPPPIQDATLPAFLVEATLRCLKKHPDQRFLDAAQMRQFLLQHLPSEAWLHTRETKEEVSSLAKGIPNLYDTQGKPASPASAALLKAAPSSPFQPITPPNCRSLRFGLRSAHHNPPLHLWNRFLPPLLLIEKTNVIHSGPLSNITHPPRFPLPCQQGNLSPSTSLRTYPPHLRPKTNAAWFRLSFACCCCLRSLAVDGGITSMDPTIPSFLSFKQRPFPRPFLLALPNPSVSLLLPAPSNRLFAVLPLPIRNRESVSKSPNHGSVSKSPNDGTFRNRESAWKCRSEGTFRNPENVSKSHNQGSASRSRSEGTFRNPENVSKSHNRENVPKSHNREIVSRSRSDGMFRNRENVSKSHNRENVSKSHNRESVSRSRSDGMFRNRESASKSHNPDFVWKCRSLGSEGKFHNPASASKNRNPDFVSRSHRDGKNRNHRWIHSKRASRRCCVVLHGRNKFPSFAKNFWIHAC